MSYQRYGHRGSEEPASVNSIDLTWVSWVNSYSTRQKATCWVFTLVVKLFGVAILSIDVNGMGKKKKKRSVTLEHDGQNTNHYINRIVMLRRQI